jgi:hypothetical protein
MPETAPIPYRVVTAGSDEQKPDRTKRVRRPRGLARAITTVQVALLDASLEEVNAQLLPLFEFSESALTRALDVVSLRKEELFSSEEYRSLRGIGQAQWLLHEASTKREMKATTGKGRKGKKTTNTEES